jgi:CheY-like chemotaxis protein
MKSSILIVDDEDVARQSLTTSWLGYNALVPNEPPPRDAATRSPIVVDPQDAGTDGLRVIQAVNQTLSGHGGILSDYAPPTSAVQRCLRIHDHLTKPAAAQVIAAEERLGSASRNRKRRARASADGGQITVCSN